jgi:hypothetical protein
VSAALDVLISTGGRAAVIWLLLILFAVIALAGLALPRGVRRPRQISAWLSHSARDKREAEERQAAEAAESLRYAGEIAVAAQGATTTAERRREDCQQAQAAVETAWQAYQRADGELDRARRAAAFATPASMPSEDERAQALRRTAQAAHRRGDLSDTQLLDALTHRNGWDVARHPVEQELALARAAARHRFGGYQQALRAEQEAWRAADIATAAVRSLRREVTVAATLAGSAQSTSERTGERTRRLPATV